MITCGRNTSEDFKENGIDRSYDEVFERICKNIAIDIRDERFVYFIDTEYVMDTTKGYRYENLTPAYDKILDFGLKQMKYDNVSNKFTGSYNLVCDNLIILADRIIDELKKENKDDRRIVWFENIKDKPTTGFEEAIQRMMFINQIFWQTDHRLVGLGAWDSFLNKYYIEDVKKGVLDREAAFNILVDMYKILHEYYDFKSNVLMGDSGQIFVIGRSTTEGEYICNDLTYLFIEAMMEVHQPEPKCLLRVNKHTPKDLIELSLKSISTGIGAPLLANDDVVIPSLIKFGIKPDDACEYATSACWEPLIGGKSSSNNNRTVINYLRALDNMFKRDNLEELDTFEKLFDRYLESLRFNLRAVKRVLKPHRFQYNPLLSVFTYGCYESKKDVSEGGALYHHAGVTSVAMGNLINSLLNIKKYVYEDKKYTLYDVKKMLINNFEENDGLVEELKAIPSIYGKDEDEIIDMVNSIINCVSEEIKDFNSYLGERMKTGLSGSAYMDAARNYGASFDGRKAGNPFVVHISNEDNEGFTEIVNFSSQLNYQNGMFNGNVLDFMVSPDFIKQNWDKYVEFISSCINVGFFEMQMNVVSYKQLVEAKANPEAFPNLIVRVWGFSSYFKDLPEEYKDVLIERALKNERKAS
ncbi:MAG: hypothetical protein IJV15_11455 [Lachnospiraceae bacterium]|nr:hypothetical protein [Lachnospiraceae bacterium]